MSQFNFSPVEEKFYHLGGNYRITTKVPYLLVGNFPKLGLLTALRFLEWAGENPTGVVSLPTGKTPEYFIRWTRMILDRWDDDDIKKIRYDHGLVALSRPHLGRLQFVQIDEFFPISPAQHNSFYNYVRNFYLRGFGLLEKNALLINCDEIALAGGRTYQEVFPDLVIDGSLRFRECRTELEKMQQESIFLIDRWCTDYEAKIRERGGIGFFLGGIGPDGHIAFNIRGADHFSTTRLASVNFETQAVAATDLGGMEVSRNRKVITIGLDTIVYNPAATAIIMAAGEAKAGIVKPSLESPPDNRYPATVLQKLPNSRFYLTAGAASLLEDSVGRYYRRDEWTARKSQRVVIDLCKRLDKYGHHITIEDLDNDIYANMIPGRPELAVPQVEDAVKAKLLKGLETETGQTFLHTGPHHDDIMLGLLPHIAHQLRSHTNSFHFAVMTSGFTAVTNRFVRRCLQDTLDFIGAGKVQMLKYPDFFTVGYKFKWDKDVYHYLDNVASQNPPEQRRGLSHRIVRAFVELYGVASRDELVGKISAMIAVIDHSYDGEKNPPDIQRLKGMIREFEEELVWAHFGVQVKNIHHLRLGFYQGDIFTEPPQMERDVQPVLDLIRNVKPTVISLALDPEGSGPDTHYKVLQAIAEALRVHKAETDVSSLRIWGYRNVWYRFHPADADVIVPCSLNSLEVLRGSFKNCYLSQVDASFPSYEYDGPFSELAQKIWVSQLKDIQLLLGKNFFYENPHPRIRAAHGLLYFKEMNVDEFLAQARELEKAMGG